jgi:mannose-6-phosphate isomerase
MNRIYPLKFRPVIKDKIWGGEKLKNILNKKTNTSKAGESWEISGFPGSVSRVSNGFLAGNNLEELIEIYMGDLVGEGIFEKFGTLFPLLIKFIDANEKLSIQVHPDNKLASKLFNSYGKTEMWYILGSDPGSEIILGFNKKLNREEYLDHLKNKTLPDILNREKVSPGDVFFLPSGRVHSIGEGILLAEIQQTSDATLRIYDFDRVDENGKPRPLHNDKALDAIDFNIYNTYRTEFKKEKNTSNRLVSCDFFTTNYLELDKPVRKDLAGLDSFVIYICIEGEVMLKYFEDITETLKKGETILVPAEMNSLELLPEKTATLLEVYIEDTSAAQKADNAIEKFF